MSYPNIPDEYFWNYIRGYFDSDGGVAKDLESVYFYSSTPEFLKELQDQLENRGISTTLDPPKANGVSTLRVLEDNDSKRNFYKNLYSDPSINLNRKKQIFDDYYHS